MFNAWLHIISLIAYLGAIIGLTTVLLPSLATIERHDHKLRFLTRALRLYNPMQVGALGVLLFTGAFQVTQLKAAYRDTFLQQFGYSLGLKLLFVFILVIFSVYQAMGIGHRLVRRYEGGDAVTPREFDSCVKRLKSSNWCILLLALITLWLGLRLQPAG